MKSELEEKTIVIGEKLSLRDLKSLQVTVLLHMFTVVEELAFLLQQKVLQEMQLKKHLLTLLCR